MLLGGAPVVVEGQHPLVRHAAVGDDEAEAGKQLTRMELDLGHHTARLRPALRPIVETCVVAHDMVRRSARPAFCQPGDLFVELRVAFDADGVIPALGFQQIEERRDGECGVGTEPPPGDRRPSGRRVSRQHRPQDIFPAIGAVHIAGAQRTPLQFAELVEHEQGMQALRLEMAVPGRSLLIAMHRAFRAVHVQRDDLRRPPVMHRVDPATRQIDQHREVVRLGQHLGLEPAHGASRGCTVLHRAPADQLAHHRVAA